MIPLWAALFLCNFWLNSAEPVRLGDETSFGGCFWCCSASRDSSLVFFIHMVTSTLFVLLFPPSRCVVVLFNPRKNKQHHILNSSR